MDILLGVTPALALICSARLSSVGFVYILIFLCSKVLALPLRVCLRFPTVISFSWYKHLRGRCLLFLFFRYTCMSVDSSSLRRVLKYSASD